MSFRIKVATTKVSSQEIYCDDNASYDKAEKLAEKLAKEQIDFICQEFNVEKKDLKIDFEPSSYKLKVVYEDEFTRGEKNELYKSNGVQ